MKKGSTTWVLDEKGQLIPVKNKDLGSKYGFLFFTICALILAGAIGQFVIFTGQFFSEQMEQVSAITMWILVVVGIIISALLMVSVRNRRINYAEDSGYDSDTQNIKEFEGQFSKLLREEKVVYEEQFGVEVSFDDYATKRWTGWKKLKKMDKKGLLPEGFQIKDVDNDGDIEVVKKDDQGNFVQFSLLDPEDDGEFEFHEWDPDELKIIEPTQLIEPTTEEVKPASITEAPEVVRKEESDEELFQEFLKYKKKKAEVTFINKK